jgi:hypothetical protein
MARRVDPERAAMWRERFERFQQSRMTVTRFCQVEGFSAHSFYYWRQQLTTANGEEASGDATSSTAANRASHAKPASNAFAPVHLIGTTNVAAWLPGGTRLEIPLADLAAARVALEAIILADGRRADAEAGLGKQHSGERH